MSAPEKPTPHDDEIIRRIQELEAAIDAAERSLLPLRKELKSLKNRMAGKASANSRQAAVFERNQRIKLAIEARKEDRYRRGGNGQIVSVAKEFELTQDAIQKIINK